VEGDVVAATAAATIPYRYVELAIRRADDSVVTAFLWRHPSSPSSLIGTPLRLRVGGAFVFPPPGIAPSQLRRLVLVAGGMGVNPLVSIAAHLAEKAGRGGGAGAAQTMEVRFLYSLRDSSERRKVDEMLFVERLAGFYGKGQLTGGLRLFLTSSRKVEDDGGGGGGAASDEQEGLIACNGVPIPFVPRRIKVEDIAEAVGPDRRFAAVYVCGVPSMTDEFVARLTVPLPDGVGMEQHRVLFEKWW